MKRFLDTTYGEYRINEGKRFDYDKINCLRKRRIQTYKDMWLEKDFKKRKRLELEIKILDIKTAIEKLKQ